MLRREIRHVFKYGVLIDDWVLWPVITSIVVQLLIHASFSFFVDPTIFLTLITVSVFPFVILSLFLTIIYIGICLWRRLFRKALSFIVAILLPFCLQAPLVWFSRCAHAEVSAHFGLAMNGPASKNAFDGTIAYDWSSGFAGMTMWDYLIYDPSNRTESYVVKGLHSARPKNLDFGLEEGQVCPHLFGHYYECRRNE